MASTVVIELSLVEESKGTTKAEIIRDIMKVFSNGEIIIPWIDNILEIKIQ